MPYVKITGYVEVRDSDYVAHHRPPLTPDGSADVDLILVSDLEDLSIEPDDREGS